MSQTDIMRELVRRRLEHWGMEYALGRQFANLGYPSKNMLYTYIKEGFKARVTGMITTGTTDADEIELIMTDVARADLRVACCMRGYFCGSERRKIERFQQAMTLCEKLEIRRVSLSTYLNDVELGSAMVRVELVNRGAVTLDSITPRPL